MKRPFLANDRVRFVGEPVAAVLTEQPYQGPDAAELVVVDYDPLPAVVDLRAAAPDEVLLFPEAGTNTATGFGLDEPFDEHLFDGCEVVVTAGDRQPAARRLAAGDPRRRGASGATTGGSRSGALRRTRRPPATRWRAGSASTPRSCA